MLEIYKKNNQNRVKNDFYATPPMAVDDLCRVENIEGYSILENSAGLGHITRVLRLHGNDVFSVDLVDRGFKLDYCGNFLDSVCNKKFDMAIYNPPFTLISEFIDKTFEFTDIQFVLARIQLLESKQRYRDIFKDRHLEKIYVFSSRITCIRNGDETIKKLPKSMCFAWFKFNKLFDGFPTLQWL